jgi:hypothetical protein
LWRYEWAPPSRGSYSVVARAYDGAGRVQTTDVAPPFPSGSSGLDGIRLVR